MASLRKRYQQHVEPDHHRDDAPVTTAPTTAAQLPPASDHPEAPAPHQELAPDKVAEQSAIRSRLNEMQDAERLSHQPVEPPSVVEGEQPQAAEPPRQQTPEEFIDQLDVPKTTKDWLKRHPEVVTDSALSQEIRALHNTARRRAGGEEFSENYFRALDDLLGFQPASNGRHLPASEPPKPPYNGRSQPPRPSAPTSQPPPAAPPARPAISLRTGRRQDEPIRLTPSQMEIVQINAESFALTGMGKAEAFELAKQSFIDGVKRVAKEKEAGLHQ